MSTVTENELVELVVAELESEGYQVVREPSRSMLPSEARSYQPDLVALRPDGNVLVEITMNRAERELPLMLRRFLDSSPTWKRRVFHFRSTNKELPAPDERDLVEEYFRFRELVRLSHVMPAVLVGWACLEASARQLSPRKYVRPQSPARVLETLAEDGVILPRQADTLRSLIEKRNRYVHGDFSASASLVELRALDEVLREMHPRIKNEPL